MYSCKESLVVGNNKAHHFWRFLNMEFPTFSPAFEIKRIYLNKVDLILTWSFYFWPIEQLGYLIRNGHSDKYSTPQQFTRPINFFLFKYAAYVSKNKIC